MNVQLKVEKNTRARNVNVVVKKTGTYVNGIRVCGPQRPRQVATKVVEEMEWKTECR